MKQRPEVETIEQVAQMAMDLGRKHLADYGATRSRHDFTQRQLMSCLILRAYLKTTYRGLLEVLAVSSSLRACLGLTEKLPHYTTLQKFSGRARVLEIAQQMIATIAQAAFQPARPVPAAAMDSTGFTIGNASAYFAKRQGKTRKCRRWVKLSVIVLCGSLLPAGLVVDLGPSNDRIQVPALLEQAQAVSQPTQLFADAGYDAEWIHVRCHEQWGVQSVIKPNGQRADGTRGGKWRKDMSPENLRAWGYGRRWAVESFFSGLKRTMGHALNARRTEQMLAEATFRVLAYALRR